MKTILFIALLLMIVAVECTAQQQTQVIAYGRATTARVKIDFGDKVFFSFFSNDTTAGADTLFVSTDTTAVYDTTLAGTQVRISERFPLMKGETASPGGLQGRYLWVWMSSNTSKFRIYGRK